MYNIPKRKYLKPGSKKIILILLALSTFNIGCKKSFRDTKWDVDLLIPIAKYPSGFPKTQISLRKPPISLRKIPVSLRKIPSSPIPLRFPFNWENPVKGENPSNQSMFSAQRISPDLPWSRKQC